MNDSISLEIANRFVITGYVKDPQDNFLSFTVLEGSTVFLLVANYGGQEINQKLRAGVSLDQLIQGMQPFQYTMAQFPIQDLLSISWSEHSSSCTFSYRKDSKTKRFKTEINSDKSRTTLLYLLQSHFRDPFHYLNKTAGAFRVAWHFFLGTMFSIIAFIWFCFFWDPADFQGGNRGDWLFLFFGQTGCAIIAAGFIVGTIYNAWNAIKKRSQIYYCLIQNDNHCSGS